MLIVNFSHPLTPEQVDELSVQLGAPLDQIITVPTQLDHEQAFVPQVRALLAAIGLPPDQWQQVVIVPPAFSPITAVLLAVLHGWLGYFPPIVRLRPVPGSIPPRFAVAEVISLHDLRDAARHARWPAE